MKKFYYNKEKDKLLDFWIKEKKGLGLKRTQFILDVKKSNINFILRTLRKKKEIIYKQRRWFLKPEFYKELKHANN